MFYFSNIPISYLTTTIKMRTLDEITNILQMEKKIIKGRKNVNSTVIGVKMGRNQF